MSDISVNVGIQDEDIQKHAAEAQWEHEELAKLRVKVFRGHTKGINSCAFLNNCKWLLSAGDDKTIRLWNAEKGEQRQLYHGHDDKVSCVKGTTDGNRLLSAGWDKKLICWDLTTEKQLWSKELGGIATSCDISMDGKYAVSGNDIDHAVQVWDLTDGQSIKKLKYHQSTVTSCCFSPVEYRFCTTSMDLTSRIVDMRNYVGTLDPHCVVKIGGHTNMISCCSFSGNEKFLATGSWDKNIQLWDVHGGTYRRSGPVTLSKGHEGSISGCKFSQDGSMLISSSYDESLVIWDVLYTCKKISLKGHTGWVTACDISNDNKWVLSSSKDRTLRLWNIEETDEIPIVVQNRKNIGLTTISCCGCGNTFSLAESQDPKSVKYCVFCRLKNPSSVYLLDAV